MQSEEFDKKIKSAADHHHPAYDEQAWDKMNKLLDKHLPEEKERRRGIIFWFLFPLLLAGGVWLGISVTKNKKTPETVQVQNPKHSKDGIDRINPKNNSSVGSSPAVKGPGDLIIPGTGKEQVAQPDLEKNNKSNPVSYSSDKVIKDPQVKNGSVAKAENSLITYTDGKTKPKTYAYKNSSLQGIVVASSGDATEKKSKKENLTGINPANKPDNADSKELKEKNVMESKKPETALITPVANSTDVSKKAEETDVTEESSEKTKAVSVENIPVDSITEQAAIPKEKKKQVPEFFLSVSAGPDVSAVGTRTGKTELATGVGIGYNLSERFTIRTGFYSVKKVYSADGSDYKGNTLFLSYYPNLKSVDGDCRVYEIPLLLDYNFGAKNNHSWFISTGLSSLLMKKETYDYYYKPNYSQNYIHKSYTFKNENKHLFSVLALSGGYTQKLGNHFSLRAEPYARLPLTGIGAGKINLNGAGVLFSVIIQ